MIVNGYTAEKMQQIIDKTVKSGSIVADDLILTLNDGTTIDAGNVRGPQGLPGTDVNAKAYSDAGDATTLASAKSYADTGDSTTLNSGKAYADTQDIILRRGVRAQRLMSGGGVRKVDSIGISWSARFIIMGLGKGTWATNGYFEITTPPDGTAIPCTGGSNTAMTVASGRVPLNNWQALYYDVPYGGAQFSDASRFQIIEYTVDRPADIPATWVLIAYRNGDSLQPSIMWGDGRTQDYWRSLTLVNSWVNYASNWPVAGYRFMNDGQIGTRGLIKSGVTGTIATLPTALAPEGISSTGAMFQQAANGGSRRVDVHGDATIVAQAPPTGVDAGYLSLDGIRWFPVGA